MGRTVVICLYLWAVHLTWVSPARVADYDFEDTDFFKDFRAVNSTMSLDQSVRKSKAHSLLWTMKAQTAPKLKLALTVKEVKHLAIKFWIYRETPASPNTRMTLTFRDKNTGDATPPVILYLHFKGWRAVWLSFNMFEGWPRLPVNDLGEIEFGFTSTLATDEKVYFDLIRVLTDPVVHRETRDRIVRNERPLKKEPYDERAHTQLVLKWSEHPVPAPDQEDAMDVDRKIADIKEIENRLDDWFANRTKSLHDNGVKGKPTEFEAMRTSRWAGMIKSFYVATTNYEDDLTFLTKQDNIKIKITGPPLFGYRSEYGHHKKPGEYMKFCYVFQRIFFPLAMEYGLKSRKKEIHDTAQKECFFLKYKGAPRDKAVARIAGQHQVMREYLEKSLPAAGNITDCKDQDIHAIEEGINKLNDERWRRIKLLLDYLEDQGWADGSALGAIDAELLQSDTTFIFGLFLIRHKLKLNPAQYTRWLNTAKWYSRFNDIYRRKEEYELDGENADICRHIMRQKLHIIIMQQHTTVEEKQNIIRDMRFYKTWVENGLKINKALGPLIKPDYTSFHHMRFYGASYVLGALHNIAIASCHLEGTWYSLNNETKFNLRKALGVFRIVAVKYSTPNGISGRFASYKRQSLIKEILPALAYISYIPRYRERSPTLYKPRMFLRLCDLSDDSVLSFLRSGGTAGFNFHSMGSLDIMLSVKEIASEEPEKSPTGHWTLSYACMNVHRRKNWSVVANGFGKYVWSNPQSSYGFFQSHGTLQISNSEAALDTYDVDSGWNWTNVQGGTTINLSIDEIKSRARTYNKASIAGGVRLRGNSNEKPQNGVFGMELQNPLYKSPPPAGMKDYYFVFKKSFFFMDHLIVCMGSDIKLKSLSGSPIKHHAQTTLFQDKQVDTLGNQNISVGGNIHNLTNNVSLIPQFANDLDLKDTHGNTYRVYNVDSSQLRVGIQKQISRDTYDNKETYGRYAKALLKHKEFNGSSYLYAILVEGGDTSLLDKFEVKQKDNVAHVVQFKDLPTYGAVTTGYTVFKANGVFQGGPIKNASAPCIIMTEQTGAYGTGSLHIALSNPAFNMVDDPTKINKTICSLPGKRTNPPNTPYDVGRYLMYCTESDLSSVQVSLHQPVLFQEAINVWVDDVKVEGSEKSDYVTVDSTGMQVTFKGLRNGFTMEAKFNI